MAARTVELSKGLFHWCFSQKIKMRSKVVVGDICVCSQKQNWEDPDDMGRALFVAPKNKPVQLPAGHRDGDKCNIFILTFKKQRKPRGQLKGLCFVSVC